MAGILAAVYSIAVLVVAVAGIAFVSRQEWEPNESGWWRWGASTIAVVFLIAMVGWTLLTA